MISHPVLFEVERAPRMDRLHVLVRLLLLVAIGALGLGSVYWVLYLVPPLVVALLVSGSGRVRYLAESAPVVVRVMRWFAGAYAYLWLLTDTVPAGGEEGPVAFEVEIGGWPTMGSALKRLVTSLPALVLLVVLHVVAHVLWVVGAVCVLVAARMPAAIHDFLALTLRYQFRLAAYHVSIVDAYPSFDLSVPHAPRPRFA